MPHELSESLQTALRNNPAFASAMHAATSLEEAAQIAAAHGVPIGISSSPLSDTELDKIAGGACDNKANYTASPLYPCYYYHTV